MFTALSIAALTLGLASATEAAAEPSRSFKLPDGSAKCIAARYKGEWSLHCDWKWKPRAPEEGTEAEISLRARGRAKYTLLEGGGAWFTENTLEYGERWRAGPFRCKAIRPGVKCRSTVSSHGFRVRPHRLPRLF